MCHLLHYEIWSFAEALSKIPRTRVQASVDHGQTLRDQPKRRKLHLKICPANVTRRIPTNKIEVMIPEFYREQMERVTENNEAVMFCLQWGKAGGSF